ncbi:MAG: molybdopterin molybdenumtransferase MoeA, partial [Paenibacillus sp.]|nr:molybdopterin molybdenumtransferase MoeA [Paenibacillus sp.]
EQSEETIYRAADTADLILTTGGVSVGDYDMMAEIFNNLKGTLLFNKIAMRPGSVTTAGVMQSTLLFGLSGNPGACFVGFKLFVLPALYGMLGQKEPYPRTFSAYLKGDFTKGNAYTRFVRGKRYIREGLAFVEPVGKDRSGVSVSIKDSDCLILIPPGGRGKRDGELVEVLYVMFKHKYGYAEQKRTSTSTLQWDLRSFHLETGSFPCHAYSLGENRSAVQRRGTGARQSPVQGKQAAAA